MMLHHVVDEVVFVQEDELDDFEDAWDYREENDC